MSQLERLAKAGRRILEWLSFGYHRQHRAKEMIPGDVRDSIQVNLVLKNVHQTYNQCRRQARAAHLLKTYGREKEARFLGHSVSIRSRHAEVAEEVAIALAISGQDRQVVVSDSCMAIKNYAKGRISVKACRIIKNMQRSPDDKAEMVSFPAHVGDVSPHLTNLNEIAHSIARRLESRAEENHGILVQIKKREEGDVEEPAYELFANVDPGLRSFL
ncbi:hypothetical protein HPB50_013790 [Hyalomma asiaticum]|uniref:Uncharacterized protein n=1 Tax=Hyalomma asiaticum TaxID=266040 RepID=A0ACB7TJM3_HYAAI|nr:hypothetical protein HPB50_013790 [Hyalomma asiaticum]